MTQLFASPLSPNLSPLPNLSLLSLQRQGPDFGALSFLLALFNLIRFHVEQTKA